MAWNLARAAPPFTLSEITLLPSDRLLTLPVFSSNTPPSNEKITVKLPLTSETYKGQGLQRMGSRVEYYIIGYNGEGMEY